MGLLKICAHGGCSQRVPKGTRFCQRHQERYEVAQIKTMRARLDAMEKDRKSSHQRGYDHTWRKDSKRFLAANPLCAYCGRIATLVDHLEPHRGDKVLFGSRANWRSCCQSCHTKKTLAESRPGFSAAQWELEHQPRQRLDEADDEEYAI